MTYDTNDGYMIHLGTPAAVRPTFGKERKVSPNPPKVMGAGVDTKDDG